MNRQRTKTPRRTATERPRANQEDTYYGLASEVARACDSWLLSRGLLPPESPWKKTRDRIDYQLEE